MYIECILSLTLQMESQMFLLCRSTSSILWYYSHVALWQHIPEASCAWYALEFHFLSFNVLFFNFSLFSIWERGKLDPSFRSRHHYFTYFFFSPSSLLFLVFASKNPRIFLQLPAFCVIASLWAPVSCSGLRKCDQNQPFSIAVKCC